MTLHTFTKPAGRYFRIFDVNGLQWTHVVECDTVTGRIVRYKLNEHGRFYVDRERNQIAREEVYTAAPLLVVEVPPA